MSHLYYIPVIIAAYLIGSSSMALYLSRLKNIDMRSTGSGNLGASNAMMLMGWKAGIIVAVHDIGKAVIAVLLAKHFCPGLPFVGAVAGVACVLGHMYPFYLRFKGGKGLASYLGMTLALNWKLALAVMLALVIVTLITDYIALGTTMTVISVPAGLGLITHSWVISSILLVATLAMLYKHRDNYARIIRGTEYGLRRANRGDFRQ